MKFHYTSVFFYTNVCAHISAYTGIYHIEALYAETVMQQRCAKVKTDTSVPQQYTLLVSIHILCV